MEREKRNFERWEWTEKIGKGKKGEKDRRGGGRRWTAVRERNEREERD